MKVVRLSALCTGRLYPQEIFLVLISVRGWVDHCATGRITSIKIPLTPLGFEPVTSLLLKQCLNQLRQYNRQGKKRNSFDTSLFHCSFSNFIVTRNATLLYPVHRCSKPRIERLSYYILARYTWRPRVLKPFAYTAGKTTTYDIGLCYFSHFS
jgi:hypothetical protein